MYSPEFIKFLIGRDADDYVTKNEIQAEKKAEDHIMFRYARFATVPIEIKK